VNRHRRNIFLVLGSLVLIVFTVGMIALAIILSGEKTKTLHVPSTGIGGVKALQSTVGGVPVSKGGRVSASTLSFALPPGSKSFSDVASPSGLESVQFEVGQDAVYLNSQPVAAGLDLNVILSGGGAQLVHLSTGPAYVSQTTQGGQRVVVITRPLGGRAVSVQVAGTGDAYALAIKVNSSLAPAGTAGK